MDGRSRSAAAGRRRCVGQQDFELNRGDVDAQQPTRHQDLGGDLRDTSAGWRSRVGCDAGDCNLELNRGDVDATNYTTQQGFGGDLGDASGAHEMSL